MTPKWNKTIDIATHATKTSAFHMQVCLIFSAVSVTFITDRKIWIYLMGSASQVTLLKKNILAQICQRAPSTFCCKFYLAFVSVSLFSFTSPIHTIWRLIMEESFKSCMNSVHTFLARICIKRSSPFSQFKNGRTCFRCAALCFCGVCYCDCTCKQLDKFLATNFSVLVFNCNAQRISCCQFTQERAKNIARARTHESKRRIWTHL